MQSLKHQVPWQMGTVTCLFLSPVPHLVLSSQEVLSKCSWWVDGGFRGWCWSSMQVTVQSLHRQIKSGLLFVFVRDLTDLRHFLTSYSVHSWKFFSRRAYRIIRKGGNDVLLIVPQTNVLLIYEYTLQIFNHNPPDLSFTFVYMFSVLYDLSFGITCTLHSTSAWESGPSWAVGTDFLYCGRVLMKQKGQILPLHRISLRELTDFYINNEINS